MADFEPTDEEIQAEYAEAFPADGRYIVDDEPRLSELAVPIVLENRVLGVIDSEHRVFGVDRLYVVDGSVMPTQGAANPALTIMALAARAAELMTRHAQRS